MCLLGKLPEKTIDKLKEEGYDFNYIAEMDIITLAQ